MARSYLPMSRDLFAGGDGGATEVGPCLVEPELGSVFPRNWLRPRFRFIPAASQTLFEIRLHADIEKNNLVVYTSSTTWTLPKNFWSSLTDNVIDQPITIAIRGLNPALATPEPSLPTIGTVTIAPAEASGSIVYWTTTGGSLKGFSIGDESTGVVMRPTQSTGKCVGCHTSTPNGKYIAAAVSSDTKNGDPAHIELHSSDGKATEPTFMTPSAVTLLQREQQHFPTFSKAHWWTGDRIVITTYQQGLAWTDLEATSQVQGATWDMLQRNSDPNTFASHPVWSHNGAVVAYTSVGKPHTIGVLQATDIYVVPYGSRSGGLASPLAGATDVGANEYYPSFSADDRLVAFTKSSGGASSLMPFEFAPPGSTYSDPYAEVFVIPAEGGIPKRLAANDPPACSGKQSPGLTNSWAKWSPQATTVGEKTYYWLTFSSNRATPKIPQLYVTPIIVDASGQIATVPRHLPVESAAHRKQPHAGMGRVRSPPPPIN